MIENILETAVKSLQDNDELTNWENKPFCGLWPESKQKKPQGITKTTRKKPKRIRTAYTTEQLKTLEKTYSAIKYIDSNYRRELARKLKIEEKCIKIWFQNRRMKEKRDSSDSSCDSSSEHLADTPSPPSQTPIEEPVNVNNENYELETPNYQAYSYPNQVYQNQSYNSCTPYYVNNGMYSTEYYPSNETYNNYENQYQNINTYNYWCPSNFDSYYYIN